MTVFKTLDDCLQDSGRLSSRRRTTVFRRDLGRLTAPSSFPSEHEARGGSGSRRVPILLETDSPGTSRATAYGITSENLPDFYRNRTLLKTEVTADDVAEAALFLAGPRSAKTTGAMIPVDGGVKEAFPR